MISMYNIPMKAAILGTLYDCALSLTRDDTLLVASTVPAAALGLNSIYTRLVEFRKWCSL